MFTYPRVLCRSERKPDAEFIPKAHREKQFVGLSPRDGSIRSTILFFGGDKALFS